MRRLIRRLMRPRRRLQLLLLLLRRRVVDLLFRLYPLPTDWHERRPV